MPSNYHPDDWAIVPRVPRDPMWINCYVGRGDTLRSAIQRKLRNGVIAGLRRGDDGRSYVELRYRAGPEADYFGYREPRDRAERRAVRIRLPAAVDRAVRGHGPSGSFAGLRFTLAIPHVYLFDHWDCWK